MKNQKITSIILCLCMIASVLCVPDIGLKSYALEYSGSDSYEDSKYYDALTNVILTGDYATDIVNIAQSQIGYLEGEEKGQLSGTVKGKNDYTEYGDWFQKGSHLYWCQIFVSWCAFNAGIPTSIINKTSSTVQGLNAIRKNGEVHTLAEIREESFIPEPGDIVYFKSSNTGDDRAANEVNHTGICTGFDGNKIYTIEGNTKAASNDTNGTSVTAKSYNIDTTTYIKYVCRPNYGPKKNVEQKETVGPYKTAVEINMTKYADPYSAVIQKIPANTDLEVVEISEKWGYTTYNNRSGWVDLSYCKKVGKSVVSLYKLNVPVILIRDSMVTIQNEADDVTIYYTLDSTNPTTKSLKYTSPFKLESYVKEIRAIAVKTGFEQSDVVSKKITSSSKNDTNKFSIGDKVKVVLGAKNYYGIALGASDYEKVYEVMFIDGDKISIGNGEIFELVMNYNDLRLYNADDSSTGSSLFNIQGDGKGVYSVGVDLCQFNNNVDFNAIKSAGYNYVLLRLGTTVKDDAFDYYYDKAKAVGLDVGAIIYTFSTSDSGAYEDAENALIWLGGRKLEYPIYYHVEDYTQKNMGKAKLTNMCKTFCDELKHQGYVAGIRVISNWAGTYIDVNNLSNYEVWYVKDTQSGSTSMNFSKQYGMWRYSSTQKIGKSDTNLSTSVAYKKYPSLIKAAGLNGYSKSNKVNTPIISFENNYLKIVNYNPNSKIYYTFSGLNPTSSSTVYTEPIKIEKSCVVKAVVITNDGVESAVATKELNVSYAYKIYVGDRVKLQDECKTTYEGKPLVGHKDTNIYTVISIKDDRAILEFNGNVMFAVNVFDLEVANAN